jgi:AcrR family transcriptional regulator
MQGPFSRFSTMPPAPPSGPEDYRVRLMDGLAQALAEKRYADTTIADIVRHARVSKRTFYEHFPDKEACFLATYNALSDELLSRIGLAVDRPFSPDPIVAAVEAISAAVHAYFGALEEHAAIIGPFFTDVQAAGPAALSLRREIHHRFADAMRLLVDARLPDHPGRRGLTPEMAMALVGAVNELVLMAIETKREAHVSDLSPTAIDLFLAVLSWDPASLTTLTSAPLPSSITSR